MREPIYLHLEGHGGIIDDNGVAYAIVHDVDDRGARDNGFVFPGRGAVESIYDHGLRWVNNVARSPGDVLAHLDA